MTVTAPSAGVMVVRACGSLVMEHLSGAIERFTVQIHEDESGTPSARAPEGDQVVSPPAAASGEIQHRFCVEGHFPASAGAKTFYLRAYKGSTGEFWDLSRSYISALFVASTLP
jgi:hypothetical protein